MSRHPIPFPRPLAMVAAAGLAVMLAGCLPNAPTASSPYQGLTAGGQAPSAGTSFPISGRGRSIGVLASNNTERSLAYLEETVNTQRTSPLLNSHYRPGNEEFKKPRYLFDVAMSSLRRSFGRVVQINDLNQARGLDYVAILDLKAVLPTPMNHSFSYDMGMEFLTGSLQRIGTVNGADSQSFTSDCYGWGDKVIDCGVNLNITAIRNTADKFRAAFQQSVR